MIVGYPKPKMLPSGRDINGPPVMVLTRLLREVPASAMEPENKGAEVFPVNKGVDLFFECQREATNLIGEPEEMIALEGISGTSVWQYTDFKGSIWSPERCVRIVAVESACKKEEYIRAISSICVLKLLLHATGRTITVHQTRSPIGRPADQRATLKGLKLNKIGRYATLKNTHAIVGMVKKVSHLVELVDKVVSERPHGRHVLTSIEEPHPFRILLSGWCIILELRNDVDRL